MKGQQKDTEIRKSRYISKYDRILWVQHYLKNRRDKNELKVIERFRCSSKVRANGFGKK